VEDVPLETLAELDEVLGWQPANSAMQAMTPNEANLWTFFMVLTLLGIGYSEGDEMKPDRQ
jgi:hypothetical protein